MTQDAYQWQSAWSGCASNALEPLLQRLEQQAQRWDLGTRDLGCDTGTPVYLYQKLQPDPALPSILVAGGFHGEEPAGPWGILHFLEHADPALQHSVNLALLPAVNLSGLARGTRFNQHGENPNRGFLPEFVYPPSREGAVLLQQRELLQRLAKDGLLTCHEDVLLHQAYLYSFERNTTDASLSRALTAELARHLPLFGDGVVDDCPVRDSIVRNHRDSSFESWLFDAGSARAYCTETPGQAAFDLRIAAVAGLVAVFAGCGEF